MNASDLIQNMLAAATGAARGHAKDLENYFKARTRLIADGVVAIAADRIAGKITDEDVRFTFAQIKKSEATAALAVQATLKAAAQDAMNAALAVASAAINKAVGVAIL